MSDELKLRRDPDIQVLLNRISLLEGRVKNLEDNLVAVGVLQVGTGIYGSWLEEAEQHSHNCRWFEYQACDCGAHDK